MSDTSDQPLPPSLPWRLGSAAVMGFVGTLTRIFMHVPNSQYTNGLDEFLQLVDSRQDVSKRERGLITFSNHVCILDDPLLWGILPFRHHFNPSNHRWQPASHDICFTKAKVFNNLLSLGQTLPTHRLQHSPYGGLFQPTMREAVRLLSRSPISETSAAAIRHSSGVDAKDHARNITDPFSCPTHTYTYSTNGDDTFPAPAAYLGREYSWIHIFPEGKVHQHPKKTMRYFKWGVARLILEPDVCPDLVPMWIEGNDQIMHETRKWPRFIPRIGKQCGVWIGENVGGEKETVFHELRERWQKLKLDSTQRSGEQLDVGNLNDELKYGQEAVELREECARQVRKAVLDVRRKRGLPDEDPKAGLVETWREEGGKAEGRMKDDSIVKDA